MNARCESPSAPTPKVTSTSLPSRPRNSRASFVHSREWPVYAPGAERRCTNVGLGRPARQKGKVAIGWRLWAQPRLTSGPLRSRRSVPRQAPLGRRRFQGQSIQPRCGAAFVISSGTGVGAPGAEARPCWRDQHQKCSKKAFAAPRPAGADLGGGNQNAKIYSMPVFVNVCACPWVLFLKGAPGCFVCRKHSVLQEIPFNRNTQHPRVERRPHTESARGTKHAWGRRVAHHEGSVKPMPSQV